MPSFARPTDLDAALDALKSRDWLVLAGGTDVYPAQVGKPFAKPVLDISALSDLRGITRTADGFTIGALTTWTDVIQADLPPAFDALKLAAREVGSVQVQNAGTVAGNLCNASPAADGVPPLLILDARVELQSKSGSRRMPLSDFIRGNRDTALRRGEMLTHIHIPETSTAGGSTFLKLGARKYLVISIVMVAARLRIVDGRVTQAALSVGACSAVAQRLPLLEQTIIDAGTFTAAMLTPEALAPISPIDDVRADAGYRREAAAELIARAVTETLP